MVAGVELPINRNASAMQMAEEMFGPNADIRDATYTGDRDSSGIYTNGDAIAPGVTPGDTGVMFSTGDLRGFTNNNASQSNLSSSTTTNSSGRNGVADFDAAAGAPTFDASYIDIDFVPDGDMLTHAIRLFLRGIPRIRQWRLSGFRGRLDQRRAGATQHR